MKRPLSAPGHGAVDSRKMKSVKVGDNNDNDNIDDGDVGVVSGKGVYLDDNVLFEVLKHVDDARSLAMASCVSKQWHKTAQDERLWERICTKQWPKTTASAGGGEKQLRSVVLALGGFRRLHSLYLWPLSKSSHSSSLPSSISTMIRSNNNNNTRLGKDEVHLSLSLLSVRYYEKMNFNTRNR